ncbi:sugar ABC transporter permease [uncultured Sphaerochaeta sp.]|uniref:carbohydrate ABC transporter permease n=1 Tax=uncultured Sphaerochaeta sp. TaxID=886478 RepID=UPI0029CA9369|nr:sugar ABC transporter permease [uncultured Sphaerochaeta sp.]
MQAVGTRNRWIWSARILFLLPVSLLFFFFFIYPFFFTVFTSFTSWRGIGSMEFNGVKNYAKLIADPTFQKALGNNIVWALSQGLIQVPLSCLVAMILVRKPFGWRGLRTIYYLPNVISTVALAMVWVAIYNVDGPLNAILASLFGMEKHNWLGNPDTALFSVIFQTVIYIGYFMIVLLASAMNIPRSLYEAAEIDGASTFAQEINITLPMLRGTLITTMTLAMAYGMRHFEATFLMTGGGPAYATTTMGIDLYLKMDALRYSEASTSGVFLIIMGTLVITLLRKLFGSSDPMSEMAQ